MTLITFTVQLKNRYEEEDNGFLGFMIVAVPEKSKDEKTTVGNFLVSVFTKI